MSLPSHNTNNSDQQWAGQPMCWHPPDLAPGWAIPMPPPLPEEWRPPHPDQPALPPPHGQLATSHPTPTEYDNHPRGAGPLT
ncbi:uncharacterized protein ARMOST_12664 [Armillaria ostoyae]|uniref:Uncharacterized protein n=1 Tax=Armillaria ostoyae TaxID=47428 RepID=A0A284RKL6_ARMOS|nr:uncharacterized protein ARMOST_12664 [Armillaria ostoyae]